MDELNKTAQKRAMDAALMGNDRAVLQNLVGLLNNPNITGAVVPEEEKRTNIAAPPIEQIMEANAKAKSAATVKAAVQHTQTQIAPAVAHSPTKQLFFTGHPRVGKTFLAQRIKARVFEFDDPILAMATIAFGVIEDKTLLVPFIDEVRAWGEGDLKAPLTAARAMFIDSLREAGAEGAKLFGVPVSEFGRPGFWADCLFARVTRFQVEFPNQTVAVTDVKTEAQYRALREKGFRAYHVACSTPLRVSRGAAAADYSAIAHTVEKDMTRVLSQEPNGGKLWCVWNDPDHPSPSPRLLSLKEFFSAYTS